MGRTLNRVTKTRGRLLTALVTAGLATAGLGAAVLPASAEMRTFVVTLATGQSVTVTVDLPPGTVPSASALGITGPVVSISEVTPPASAQPGVGVDTGQAPNPTQPQQP